MRKFIDLSKSHPPLGRWEDADPTQLPLPDPAAMGKELSEDEQDKQNGLKQEVQGWATPLRVQGRAESRRRF